MYLKNILYSLKFRLIISILLTFISKLIIIIPTLLIGKIIDSINSSNGVATNYILLIAFSSVFYLVFSPFSVKFTTKTTQVVVYKFSLLITKNIFNKDYDFYKNSKIGGILRQTERGIISHEKLLTYFFNLIIPNIIMLAVICGYIFLTIGVLPFLICIFYSILTFLLLVKIISIRRKYIKNVNDAEDDLGEVFAETFMCAKTIKFRDTFDDSTKLLKNNYKKYGITSTELSFYTEIIKSLQFLSTNILTIIVIVAGIYLTSSNQNFTIGDFVVFISLSALMMTSIISLSEGYKEYDQFTLDGLKLKELLELPEINNPKSFTFNEEFKMITIGKFDLEIQPNQHLINPEEIVISKGQKVALIGKTGQGKSTLLNLLSGIRGSEKTIYINKTDLKSFNSQSISKVFSYSFQNPEFLSGDLKRAVFLDSEVSNLAFENFKVQASNIGFSYFMSSSLNDLINLKNFSGGEIKRLDLLRILSFSTDVLILDEPTSSLDHNISKEVWTEIFSIFKEKTIICATHDTSYLHKFDTILHVEHGVIRKCPVLEKSTAIEVN